MAKAKESGLSVRHEDVDDDELYADLHQILCSLRRVELGFEGLGVVGRSLRSVQGHAVDEALRDSYRVFGKTARQNRLRVSSSLPDLPRLPYEPYSYRGGSHSVALRLQFATT